MLKHTSTIGLRAVRVHRAVLERHAEKRQTPWGEVTVKISQGYGVRKVKGEFDEMAEIARANGPVAA